jgi:hypothetical protein
MTDNEILAIFMGMKKVHCTIDACKEGENWEKTCDFDYCGGGVWYRYGNTRYEHHSISNLEMYQKEWDELMPVVGKINELISSNDLMEDNLEFSGMMDVLELALIRADITQAYSTIVSIVKFYNESLTKTN